MMQIKNNTNKQITFPAFDFSIGPNEVKEVTDDMSTHVISYPDIAKVKEKIKIAKDDQKIEKIENVDKKKEVSKFKERKHINTY